MQKLYKKYMKELWYRINLKFFIQNNKIEPLWTSDILGYESPKIL
jgi:hypothetical protein